MFVFLVLYPLNRPKLYIMAYNDNQKRSVKKLEWAANYGKGKEKLIAKHKLAEIALNKAKFAVLMYDYYDDVLKWQAELPF